MKKSLFLMAAASALMLTACTSESDVLQTATKQEAPKAVGFDVYTPAATNVTRAGLEGTMTTSRLQRSEALGGGFGVYAFLVEDALKAAGSATGYTSGDGSTAKIPDFMVNQKLLWNAQNQGWYYNPLKYWPNETDKDSQNTPAEMETMSTADGTEHHTDRLTFFAYAPYVSAGTSGVTGITAITKNDGTLDNAYTPAVTPKDPSVSYKAELSDPNKVVDLLWGVAPSGGLSYTAVNGTTVSKEEGLPLIDMTKPDVNTNMKFLFQHALARIGITAVAAIDQVSPGGTLDPNTKITIKSISLTGKFGDLGVLNLNNANKNVANWTYVNSTEIKSPTTAISESRTLNLAVGKIAEHLQYVADAGDPAKHSAQTNRVGVTTVRQNVIAPSDPEATTFWSSSKTYTAPVPYSESTPFYTSEACTEGASATITTPTSPAHLYTMNSAGAYTESSVTTLTYPAVNEYYVATFKQVVADDYASYDATTMVKVGDEGVKKMQAYDRTGSSGSYLYTPDIVGKAPVAGEYVLVGDVTKATANYVTGATTSTPKTLWTRDANYFMVVPTDNLIEVNKVAGTPLNDEQIKTLHTVRVKIEYYITTEDAALADGRTQTKNVIEKDVVFPSIANGKSYNLNLILGLTSVKMEAEVDDWKVINVQGDLPQNTAD